METVSDPKAMQLFFCPVTSIDKGIFRRLS